MLETLTQQLAAARPLADEQIRLAVEQLTDEQIPAAVKAGFLVRTRADADTVEARANDTRRRETALASGAQYVSTDYMRPDKRFSPYQARMPQGVVAACNPQRHPERCAGIAVEAATITAP